MSEVRNRKISKSPFEYSLTKEQLVSKEIIFSWDEIESFWVKKNKKYTSLFLYKKTQLNKLFLIVLCAYFNVKSSFDNDGVVGFKTSCLLRLLGYTPNSQTALNDLIKQMNIVTESSMVLDVTNIFPKITSFKRGYTYFKMSQDAINHFIRDYAIDNNFLNYQLHCVLKLKSENSINLYEIFKLKEYTVIENPTDKTKKSVKLKQWFTDITTRNLIFSLGLQNTKGYIFLPLKLDHDDPLLRSEIEEELKLKTEREHLVLRNLSRRIERCIAEINEHSDIIVSYERNEYTFGEECKFRFFVKDNPKFRRKRKPVKLEMDVPPQSLISNEVDTHLSKEPDNLVTDNTAITNVAPAPIQVPLNEHEKLIAKYFNWLEKPKSRTIINKANRKGEGYTLSNFEDNLKAASEYLNKPHITINNPMGVILSAIENDHKPNNNPTSNNNADTKNDIEHYYEEAKLVKTEKLLINNWNECYRNGYSDEQGRLLFSGINREFCEYLRSLDSISFTSLITNYNSSISIPSFKINQSESIDSLLSEVNSLKFKSLIGVFIKDGNFVPSYDFASFCLEIVGYEVFFEDGAYRIEKETLALLSQEVN